MKNDKIEWVNIFKFIGIIAVIAGHISTPFFTFIFSWHMPLFFVAAGFFIKLNIGLKEFLSKDFKRLLIPYFYFSIIALLVESLKRYFLDRSPLDLLKTLEGIFIWMDIDSLINTYAYVLWFLPALFIARFFTYLIKNYISNIIIQLLIIITLFLVSFKIQLPFSIDNGLNALIFVFSGKWIFQKKLPYWPLYLFTIFGIYYFFGIPKLNLSYKTYVNIPINVIWSYSVVLTLICVSKAVKRSPDLVSLWGNNTMLLFIFHPYTNNIGAIVANKIGTNLWSLNFLISLLLLQCLLMIKIKFPNLPFLKSI